MNGLGDKARSLLFRIYTMLDGNLHLTVIPPELIEREPNAPETAEPPMEDL